MLNFEHEECIQLLQAAVDAELIQTVPKNANSIQEDGSIISLPEGYLIFAEEGKEVGGFVQSLEDAAWEMWCDEDKEGQELILKELAKEDIFLPFVEKHIRENYNLKFLGPDWFPKNKKEMVFYLPDLEEDYGNFLYIYQGTGDDLTLEDMYAGFVDCINYQWKNTNPSLDKFYEVGYGKALLREYYNILYPGRILAKVLCMSGISLNTPTTILPIRTI